MIYARLIFPDSRYEWFSEYIEPHAEEVVPSIVIHGQGLALKFQHLYGSQSIAIAQGRYIVHVIMAVGHDSLQCSTYTLMGECIKITRLRRSRIKELMPEIFIPPK